jgi:protoporphyrinogen oxidase
MFDNAKHAVIMEAGPAGLTAAYQAVKSGVSCTVLEKDQMIGGLFRTVFYRLAPL